ncbi:MAG: prepilin-type N-terminal cleavage/methylation domain-containing protein [Candidatus Paceibacterota bacterium]
MNNLREALGQKDKKGFTLIELLIVIAILAVLATAVTLILNPAELLRQGRDSTRISDLGTLNSAIALYLADVGNPSFASTTAQCTGGNTTLHGTATLCDNNTTRAVDGNGWVAINFEDISSGSPLSNLPLDPVEDSTYYYAFQGTSSETYELNANMESTRYQGDTPGSDDVEGTDGGDDSTIYEVGNDPGFDIISP